MARAKVPCHKLITDATVIANITNPANWVSDTYIWPLTGLFEWDYYYDPATTYHYQFDGSTLYFIDTGVAIIQPAVFVPTYADLPAVWAISTLYVVESDINYWWAASNYYRDTWTSSYVYIWYAWASVDDNVKADATDPVSWFLDSKVDTDTLSVNTSTHELELHNLITNTTVIANITDEARWFTWTYTWPLWNIVANQYYYDDTSKYHYQFDGTTLYRIYSPAGPIESNLLLVNINLPTIPGKQYQSFADAFAYISTQTCDAQHPWTVSFSWFIDEDVLIPEYVTVSGTGRNSSVLKSAKFINEWTTLLIENNIRNCTIQNYISETSAVVPTPVITTAALVGAYSPDRLNYMFMWTPTYGTFQIKLTINGITYITTPIAYNASAAVVQWVINALSPDTALFTVTALPSLIFEILCVWAPASSCEIWIPSNTTDVWIKEWSVIGDSEKSSITMDNIPVWWTYRLVFNYMWTDYFSTPINYNDSIAAITSIVRNLLQAVEAASWWTLRTWWAYTSVAQSSALQYIITYNMARWDLWWQYITVDNDPAFYTLFYNFWAWGDTYARMQEVVLLWCTVDAGLILCEDCTLSGGDYSSMSMLQLKNSIISNCILPAWTASLSSFFDDDNTFNGWTFYNSIFTYNIPNTNILPWTYKFFQSTFKNVDIWQWWAAPNTYIAHFEQCSVGTLTQFGWSDVNYVWSTLKWLSLLWWSFYNKWDYFTDRIWLWVNNLQDAIVALYYKMVPVTWAWSPVWVTWPRYVGDRYIDTTWPTIYTAYGTTNVDRIS